MTRRLWRELGQLGEEAPLGSRVERSLTGMLGGGYVALWAITDTSLLMLTERERGSRAPAHREITGVVLPAGTVGVLAGGPDAVSLQSYGDGAGFGIGARRAGLRAVGRDRRAVLGRRIRRLRRPGHAGRGRASGRDRGARARRRLRGLRRRRDPRLDRRPPVWRVATFLWPDVRDLLVEGSEQTRRRVSLARVAALGPLAIAVPDEEDASRAYLTIVTAAGDAILRFAGETPQMLGVRLGDVLRRSAGTAPVGGLADELERIAGLHASGVLADDEFAAAKRRVLGL
jgi:hypothetical protein